MGTQDASEDGRACARVLIVDGHDRDREALKAVLAAAAFEVSVAKTAGEARKRLAAAAVDAIVIDPDLRDGDGLELVKSLSGNGAAIFVTASGEDDGLADRAYENGATDYSCKPVVRNEWLARLRRAVGRARAPQGGNGSHSLALNRQERSCVLDGRTLQLTRHERDFLACLVDSPNHFATYEQLIRSVWGDGHPVETQYLRVLAAQVRRKLETEKGRPPLIHTVVGEGLKLNI